MLAVATLSLLIASEPLPLKEAAKCYVVAEFARRAYAEDKAKMSSEDLAYEGAFLRLHEVAKVVYEEALIRERVEPSATEMVFDQGIADVLQDGGSEIAARRCWQTFGIEPGQ